MALRTDQGRKTHLALSALALLAACGGDKGEPSAVTDGAATLPDSMGVSMPTSQVGTEPASNAGPPAAMGPSQTASAAAMQNMAGASATQAATSPPATASVAQAARGSAGASAAAGSGGQPAAAGSGTAGTAGVAGAANSGPVDYGARGPFEVVVEKNVGESFRNTNLTDDAARCAALVSGLGADADGGDWAIYPDDMDRQLYTLFRPSQLQEGVKYPVITWGNGTCSQPLLFEPLLGHLASHGFIVIATNWRWVAGGTEMRRALDYVLKENETQGSVLYGKIAVDKLGASGHSQGSSATVSIGADKRIVATVPIQGASAAEVGQLNGPTFLIAGEKDMTVSPAGIQAAFRAARVPAAYGLSLGHDHVMPVMMPQPILKAVTAWFRIHLADDAAARPIFYAPCELCKDPTWRVETASL